MEQIHQDGIYLLHDFLSEEECIFYKNLISSPIPDSSNFTDSGIFKNKKWVDPTKANSFYTRLLTFLQEDRGRKFLGANNLLMSGQYSPGDQFGLHTDTGLFYDRKKNVCSAWSLLIYLNDDFEGGNTSFYTDSFQPTVSIKPKKGMALLFDISLWHTGEPLLSGQKSWIGCEILGSIT